MSAVGTRSIPWTGLLTAALLAVLLLAPAGAVGRGPSLTGRFPLGTHTLCCRTTARPPSRSPAAPQPQRHPTATATASSTGTSSTSSTPVATQPPTRHAVHRGGTSLIVVVVLVIFAIIGVPLMVLLLLTDRQSALERRARSRSTSSRPGRRD
jgi:hypothetical protein